MFLILHNKRVCLSQVGEEKLVLEIGRSALQYPDAKPYIHDLLLSMTLAEVRQAGKILGNPFDIFWQSCYVSLSYHRCFLEVCNCQGPF